MRSEKVSFLLDYSLIETLRPDFDDAVSGVAPEGFETIAKVLYAIADYERYGVVPDFPRRSIEARVSSLQQQRVDRNKERYDETVKSRSEAGKKGAEARWSNKQGDSRAVQSDATANPRMAGDGICYDKMANDGKCYVTASDGNSHSDMANGMERIPNGIQDIPNATSQWQAMAKMPDEEGNIEEDTDREREIEKEKGKEDERESDRELENETERVLVTVSESKKDFVEVNDTVSEEEYGTGYDATPQTVCVSAIVPIPSVVRSGSAQPRSTAPRDELGFTSLADMIRSPLAPADVVSAEQNDDCPVDDEDEEELPSAEEIFASDDEESDDTTVENTEAIEEGNTEKGEPELMNSVEKMKADEEKAFRKDLNTLYNRYDNWVNSLPAEVRFTNADELADQRDDLERLMKIKGFASMSRTLAMHSFSTDPYIDF